LLQNRMPDQGSDRASARIYLDTLFGRTSADVSA
jgi:hypothetical protein